MSYRIVVKRIVVSTIMMATILGVAGMALAAEYSADVKQIMPAPGGIINVEYKTYVKGQIERQERTLKMGKDIQIIRRDKSVIWYLIPSKKRFTETKITDANPTVDHIVSILKKMPNYYTKAGKEKVAGYVCDKYTFETAITSGTAWISPELDALLKMNTKLNRGRMGSVKLSYAMSNIKEGRQPDSLFKIPSGYKKMETSVVLPSKTGGKPAAQVAKTKPKKPVSHK